MTHRHTLLTRPSRRRAAHALLATWLAAQIAVAWAPFRFDPPRVVDNGVRSLNGGALSFSGTGARAVADPPVPWDGIDALRVDLTVRSAGAHQGGPARLLTIAGDHKHSNVVIGQEDTSLIVRVRHPDGDGYARGDIRVDGVFDQPGWHHIRVDIADTARVSVDDDPAVVRQLPGDTFSVWDPSYKIALGDAVIGERPWEGTIRQADLATDGNSHDLLTPGALDVPERFFSLPTRLREAVQPPDAAELAQSAAHLLTWLPAGAVVAALTPGRRRWRVGLAAGGLALALQLGKVAIAARHPSLLDVATQTAGALGGAVLMDAILARRSRLRA